MEALPERAYILTLGEDILRAVDEKEGVSISPSPHKRRRGTQTDSLPSRSETDAPAPRSSEKRGVGVHLPSTHPAEEGPPASQVIGSRDLLPDEVSNSPVPDRPKGKDTAGVPTTLEGLFSTGEEKSAHEVLGLLVDSHIKEAEAILGRTNLQRHEILVIARALHVARHGIGGPPGSAFDRPKPWVSQFVLDILRALPSIDGASRKQFVEAWQSAQERLRREQESKEGAQERLVRA